VNNNAVQKQEMTVLCVYAGGVSVLAVLVLYILCFYLYMYLTVRSRLITKTNDEFRRIKCSFLSFQFHVCVFRLT
jgi:hypothetical protein